MDETNTDPHVLEHLKTGDKEELKRIFQNWKAQFCRKLIQKHHCDHYEAERAYPESISALYTEVLADKIPVASNSDLQARLLEIGGLLLLRHGRSQLHPPGTQDTTSGILSELLVDPAARDTIREIAVSDEVVKIQVWQRVRPYLILAIASLAILLLVNNASPTPATEEQQSESLATQYYHAPAVLSTESTPETFSQSFADGMTAYTQHDWDAAISFFGDVDAPDERSTALYYRAHCYYNEGNFAEAISGFEQCAGVPSLKQQSEWFMALSFLSNSDLMDARDQLQRIAQNPDHYFTNEAKEILNAL